MSGDSITDHLNDQNYVIQHLSTQPQGPLNWFDEDIAFFTTPVKRLGVFGWTRTGCSAGGKGQPVRPAQHSTDGFWTIDVKIITLAVACSCGTVEMIRPTSAYLRLEVEPGNSAHEVCAHRPPQPTDIVCFQGEVLIDRDGPFYEVHPTKLWFE
jgi:hypothetical protein